MLLETDRLILVPVTPTILREKMNLLDQEEFQHEFGCDDKGYERFQGMVEKGMETFRLSLRFFLIRRKEDHITIGECGFHTWNIFHRRAELYYVLFKDEFKRQYYLSEALPPILQYGFEQMKLHRVEALLSDQNIPSKKLLLKNNFRFEGIMREDYIIDGISSDSHCYSLLQNEYTQTKEENAS